MKVALWFRAVMTAVAFAAVVSASAAAPPGAGAVTGGDRVLARAVAAPHLQSYSVPVHFALRLHKPIGIRSQVEGMAYFRAPAESALVITHASGLVGGFFKGDYKLDMVPQAWPATYHVVGTTRAVVGGVAVLQLQAQPRGAAGDLLDVIFTLSTPALQPLSAEWQYSGGFSINLAYANGRVGGYTLPLRATVAVDMPHDKLDADATYGSYALNVPVSDDVFSAAK